AQTVPFSPGGEGARRADEGESRRGSREVPGVTEWRPRRVLFPPFFRTLSRFSRDRVRCGQGARLPRAPSLVLPNGSQRLTSRAGSAASPFLILQPKDQLRRARPEGETVIPRYGSEQRGSRTVRSRFLFGRMAVQAEDSTPLSCRDLAGQGPDPCQSKT